ncbi:MAG TPA: hypothetical protein EYQ18_03775 [Candidatus Handelsmanbacteria bacterium]|nr:hypothetical protein [Candidatus Handelsmanbacteria bacterium]
MFFFTDVIHGPAFKASSTSWILSVGQLAEIAVIPCLWLLIKRLGIRGTIFSGMLAAALRSAIFALGGVFWLLVVAQSLLVLRIRGLGPLLGHMLAGVVCYYYALADGGPIGELFFSCPVWFGWYLRRRLRGGQRMPMQIGRDSFGREKVAAGAEMVVVGPEIEGLRVDVRG